MKINQKAINTLRVLSCEMIANSQIGDARVCFNSAPVFFSLFKEHYNFFGDKDFVNRDRFVLADTNATPLLYATMHQFGINLSISDLKNFGQEKEKTPAMPNFETDGVDASITNRGQGVAVAVGLAIASQSLSAKFNAQKFNVISNYTYCFVTNDCLEEGMSQEAISLAGNLKLSRLILLYAYNPKNSANENVKSKYKAMGWNVIKVNNINSFFWVNFAISRAKMSSKPSIIIFEIPEKYAFSKKIVNKNEVEKMKADFGLNGSYKIPNDVQQYSARTTRRLKVENNKWQKKVIIYKNTHPKLSEDLNEYFVKQKVNFSKKIKPKIESIYNLDEANKIIVDYIKQSRPCLVLASIKDKFLPKLDYINDINFNPQNYRANNLVFGNRENAMAEIIGGISLYFDAPTYSYVPICVFSQMLSGIEHSAKSNLPVLYTFYQSGSCVNQQKTNLQIYGQLEWLKNLKNVNIFKPATSLELLACYNLIYDLEKTACLIIPQQNYDLIDSDFEKAKKGAYIMLEETDFSKTIIASGNEVHIALKIKEELNKQNIKVKIISAPSLTIFEAQNENYKKSIINPEKEDIFVLTTADSYSITNITTKNLKYININLFTNNANEITNDLIKIILKEILYNK